MCCFCTLTDSFIFRLTDFCIFDNQECPSILTMHTLVTQYQALRDFVNESMLRVLIAFYDIRYPNKSDAH